MDHSPTHVLVIGDPTADPDSLAALAERYALSCLTEVARVTSMVPATFRTVAALHRDAKPDDWADLANAVLGSEPVHAVWHLGDDLGQVVADVAARCGVPLLGGPDVRGPDALPGTTATASVLLARTPAQVRGLLGTHVQQLPNGAVVAEHGPLPVPQDMLVRCVEHVPTTFLGAVDLADGEVVGVRPWRGAGGAVGALLDAAGIAAGPLAATVLDGGPLPPAGPLPHGLAIVGYGSAVAGELVEVEGIAAAAATPGVVAVRQLAPAGAHVRAVADGGPLLVRVAATADSPDAALDAALDALDRTCPVLDVVPSLAGATERLWF